MQAGRHPKIFRTPMARTFNFLHAESMIHVTAILEDQVVMVSVHDATKATVTVVDQLTGKSAKVDCSCEEIAAALALALAGDEAGFSAALYPTAEGLMTRIVDEDGKPSHELRIIP